MSCVKLKVVVHFLKIAVCLLLSRPFKFLSKKFTKGTFCSAADNDPKNFKQFANLPMICDEAAW